MWNVVPLSAIDLQNGSEKPAMSDEHAKSSEDKPPCRVLVVEDEPLIAYDLIAEIESGSHTVVGHVRSADEAVAFVGRERPDLIVMDIGLKGDASGLDAARRIRETYGIGCIFVSATLDRVDPAQWEAIKPLALLTKPYRDAALARAIRDAHDC